MTALPTFPKDWLVTSNQFTKATHASVYPAIDPTRAENSLKGKTVVVTGASGGIGSRGTAPAFVKGGIKTIVLVDTKAEKLAGVEKELKQINPDVKTLALSVDITSTDQVGKAWDELNAKYPKIDVLVNNAGVDSRDSDKTHEQDPDIFFRNFEVNVKGTHMMTQQYLKAATSWATTADPAQIVNITSSTAWERLPLLAGYGSSKAALTAYSAVVAASYPGTVLSFAVNPGLTDTDIVSPLVRGIGFNYNDPLLTGATLAWLVADPARSRFLGGRVLCAEWDVEELVARKDEIKDRNLLTLQLNATLGGEAVWQLKSAL
ncbi:NAD(P)-binding protein [Hypoxylon sp. FL1284]|nr:NAD(P)-binding protein [Hypoxylon sp. FL1284]